MYQHVLVFKISPSIKHSIEAIYSQAYKCSSDRRRTFQVRRLDRSRQKLGRNSILPLRRHEQLYLMGRVYELPGNERVDLVCATLHCSLMACVYAYVVYALQTCVRPHLSLPQCAVAVSLYVACVLGVAFGSLAVHANIRIASWFYPKRARQRADWLVG